MKYALILLMFTSILVFAQTENDIRVQFFPKEETKVRDIPGKENTWVFILAGQSNMAGRGLVEPQDTVPVERVLTINKNGELIVAKEPLHFYEPTRTGLDCGLSFGKELLKHIPDSINILLLPTAIGGSSISQWLGDSLYRNIRLMTNFAEKVDRGKRYGLIKGILWHQGESDANNNDIPFYKQRLKDLFVQIRKIAGNESLRILMGELGAYSGKKPEWLLLNEQINVFAKSDNNVSVIRTSDLLDKGDKVHFNSEGQRLLGERFAIEYIKSVK